jgi:hypothetical protein
MKQNIKLQGTFITFFFDFMTVGFFSIIHACFFNILTLIPILSKSFAYREKEILNESETIHNTLLDKLENLQRGGGSMFQETEIKYGIIYIHISKLFIKYLHNQQIII